MSEQPGMGAMDVTNDDRLWAALSYLPFVGWIIAAVALLMEEKRSRPFVKFSAVQSLALDVVLVLLYFLLSVVSLGVFSLCAWIIFFLPLWPAYEAYKGRLTEIPLLSAFIRNQSWA